MKMFEVRWHLVVDILRQLSDHSPEAIFMRKLAGRNGFSEKLAKGLIAVFHVPHEEILFRNTVFNVQNVFFVVRSKLVLFCAEFLECIRCEKGWSKQIGVPELAHTVNHNT